MNNEIIKFNNGNLELDVTVTPDKDTVWLTANQMALLFDRDEKTIRKHINNTFKDHEVEKENNTQKMRVVGVKQSVPFYSLDVIISVGYRVKSNHGIIFRKWATSILKDYMIKGYAVNQKRLDVLNKTIVIQSRMLASALSIEEKAANLLYFLIKDHPFVDGCKRIGASIFLEFLNKNKHLIIDGKQIISDSALVAITLMIAESRPEEKETMVKLVMNFLKCEF